jgi:carboxyl-terminal processing protease
MSLHTHGSDVATRIVRRARGHLRILTHKLVGALVIAGLAGCSSSDGSNGPAAAIDECSSTGQKEFVLDVARDWYLWNDRLPADIDINEFASVDALLLHIMSFSPPGSSNVPIDRFSSVASAESDEQFFGEGKYEGFGFSSRFESTDVLRLSRVFADSPAALGGLARGQRILALNGRSIADIQAAEGIDAVFDQSPLEFTMREINGDEFTVTISKAVVTIDPLPQWRLIPRDGNTPIAYIELAQFISTADPIFAAVFAALRANAVTDVIIDLRYNGGGLVSTAELLGDYLGGDVAENLIFSATRFNPDRAGANNRSEFFEQLGSSINLSDLVVIASAATASASELVTNSMAPHVRVAIVGDTTFGKPIGQSGFTFCENILRLTAFQVFNADGYGDYFDGLPADCAAADDLDVAVGADADANMIAALSYLETGTCPVAPAARAQSKPQGLLEIPRLMRRGPASREFADAF